MRLFTAILFPERTLAALEAAVSALRGNALSRNFTRRENLHLTLVFLGEAKSPDAAIRAIKRVKTAPFTLEFAGYGSFGGGLYWAGVKRSPALGDLYASLGRELAAEGFSIESRAYSPHVTLGREVKLDGAFNFSGVMPAPPFEVSRVSLMQSERKAGALVYTEIFGRNANL